MSRCRGCNAEIVWGQDENGRNVPLDTRPPIYRLEQWDPAGHKYAVTKMRSDELGQKLAVSHFATCPKADQFSSSKKASATARDGRDKAAGD